MGLYWAALANVPRYQYEASLVAVQEFEQGKPPATWHKAVKVIDINPKPGWKRPWSEKGLLFHRREAE